MNSGNGWKVAFVLLGLLISITMAWTAAISGSDEEQDAQIDALAENQRNIHHEQSIDRGILNRIDKNTGGEGNAPPVRELREVK